MDSVDHSNDIRIRNAQLLDEGLKDLEEYIDFPERSSKYKDVYQLYVIRAKKRDQLVEYLQSQEIECRVHYPCPLHLQKAAKEMGHKGGDFPECEKQAEEIYTTCSPIYRIRTN